MPARRHASAMRRTSSSGTAPAIVQPNAVDSAPSISTAAPLSSRALQIFASSSIICIGVLRTFDRLCSGLTEIGTPILWVPPLMASSAPRRFGASVAIRRFGSVRANATTSAVSAICGKSFGGTNEPTSISRTPAACSAAIHRHLSAVGITTSRFCSPSRGPTSTISTSILLIACSKRPRPWAIYAAPSALRCHAPRASIPLLQR